MAGALWQRPLRQHHLQLAAVHGVGAHGFRKHGDAETVLGHRLQQREVEAGQARLQVDPAYLPVRAMQLPALVGLVLVRTQGHVRGQVGRIDRAPGPVQVARAGHQQLAHLAEAAHHQAAIVVQSRTHPQGHVEAFVDQVHPAVAHVQLQAHLRVLLQEPRQQSGQLLLGQRHRHADPDQAARLGAEPVHHLARSLGLGEHGLGMAVHAHADIGDGKAPGGTLQQAHAHLALELADAPAQA